MRSARACDDGDSIVDSAVMSSCSLSQQQTKSPNDFFWLRIILALLEYLSHFVNIYLEE